MSTAQAAAELDCSEAKVKHIESGRNAPTKPDLTVLAALYRMPPEVHAQLEQARQEANTRGWWASYKLPNPLQNYVGMEADAVKVSNFELELIPGLLQTEAYARAVHEQTRHMVPATQIDQWVKARMRRQDRLAGDDPMQLHVVISEGALRRLNGAEFGVEQFRRIVAVADQPNVTVQVLPLSAGLHPSMASGFARLEFPEGVSGPVAWLESAIGGQMVDEAKHVESLGTLFADVAERALSPDESVQYLGDWI